MIREESDRSDDKPQNGISENPQKAGLLQKRKIFLIVSLFLPAVLLLAFAWFYFYGPCGTKKVAKSLVKINDLANVWDDQNRLASQTSRIALAVPVSELQRIKRDTEGLEVPGCVNPAKSLLVNAMRYTIEGYLSFMGNADTPTGTFQVASELLEQFREEVVAIKECAPFCSSSPPASTDDTLNEQSQNDKAKKTMTEMRIIGTCLEVYAVEHNLYPNAKDITALKPFLEPICSTTLPEKDAWGNNYVYLLGPDPVFEYSIISAGADGTLDSATWKIAGPFDDLNEDIVFSRGEFRRYPRTP